MAGKVYVVIKIMPESVDTDLQKLQEEIRKKLPNTYNILKFEIEPIAFGLNALKMHVTMPEDYEGGTEELERLLKDVPGVSEIDIVYITRISTE